MSVKMIRGRRFSIFLLKLWKVLFAPCRKWPVLKSSRLRSGAMKAPVGLLSDRAVLRQQDGGASPRQVRVCAAQRSNESPSGAFKRQNGLAQQDGGASPRQVRLTMHRMQTMQGKTRLSRRCAKSVQKCAEPQKKENPTRNLMILRGILVRSRELESLAL